MQPDDLWTQLEAEEETFIALSDEKEKEAEVLNELEQTHCEVCGQFTKGRAAICSSCKRSEDRANYWRAV